MTAAQQVTVILPSLNPDEKLRLVVEGLVRIGFDDIIIVNDGSDAAHLGNFPSTAEFPAVTILTHSVNRGKGAGLKTAFDYFLGHRPGRLGVVTVDGDNQHHPDDVLACAERMLASGKPGAPDTLVLGVRDFSGPDVPARSRKGNRITSFVFRVFCGLRISDTQTGLRAIPAQYLERLCRVAGDRFEYETNMLLELKSASIPWAEQPIRTVYIEENKTSHFRPFVDSLRIYRLIAKFMLSSAAAALIDIGAFYLLMLLFAAWFGDWRIVVCTFSARAISSLCNFLINRGAVFGEGEHNKMQRGTLLRYYALAIPQMLVSAGLVELCSSLADGIGAGMTTLFKLVIDTLLFLISFQIQREWVFRRNNK